MPFAIAAAAIASAATTATGIYYYPFTTSTATTTSNLIYFSGTGSTNIWIDDDAVQRRAAYLARYEQDRRVRELTMQRAARRAKSLLEEFLTPLQREQLRDLGAFTMRGASGQRYRIREGRTSNVAVLGPDGRPLHRLCAHPSELVPDADTMLTQLFMLRDAEAEAAFLAKANRH